MILLFFFLSLDHIGLKFLTIKFHHVIFETFNDTKESCNRTFARLPNNTN